MQLSRDNGLSITYVDECNIIELNLLTKRKRTVYRGEKNHSVIKYYITNTEKIIFVQDNIKGQNFLIWNEPKQRVYGSCIYFLDFEIDVHILIASFSRYYGFGRSYRIKDYSHIKSFDVSCNNQIIVFADDQHVYLKDISKSNLDDLYDTNNATILCNYDDNTYVSWVTYSNQILRLQNIDVVVDLLINICTQKTITITKIDKIHCLIEINNNKMIQIAKDYVAIYDIVEMKFIKQVKCELEFIGYSKQYDVLITKDLNYYGFDKNYELQCIVIGKNYVIDCVYIENLILTLMDTVLSNELLRELPLEILNIELYQTILYYFCR